MYWYRVPCIGFVLEIKTIFFIKNVNGWVGGFRGAIKRVGREKLGWLRVGCEVIGWDTKWEWVMVKDTSTFSRCQHLLYIFIFTFISKYLYTYLTSSSPAPIINVYRVPAPTFFVLCTPPSPPPLHFPSTCGFGTCPQILFVPYTRIFLKYAYSLFFPVYYEYTQCGAG